MAEKSFFSALLVCMTVLDAEAQTNNVYKTDTVIDDNGNVVTRDFDIAFDEISIALPSSVTYAVADKCSFSMTLDENHFECLDIYQKGDCLRVEMVKTLQQSDLKPTKFLIELIAPIMEEISLVGGGDFSFVTPFGTQKLEINMAGVHGVFFDETVTVQDIKMSLARAGKLNCENLHADQANLGVAGPESIVIKTGRVKSADITVAGSGLVETHCELESMDYNISGWGDIYYYGDVKVKGTTIFGKIERIDSENEKNNKEKCCHEKP